MKTESYVCHGYDIDVVQDEEWSEALVRKSISCDIDRESEVLAHVRVQEDNFYLKIDSTIETADAEGFLAAVQLAAESVQDDSEVTGIVDCIASASDLFDAGQMDLKSFGKTIVSLSADLVSHNPEFALLALRDIPKDFYYKYLPELLQDEKFLEKCGKLSQHLVIVGLVDDGLPWGKIIPQANA